MRRNHNFFLTGNSRSPFQCLLTVLHSCPRLLFSTDPASSTCSECEHYTVDHAELRPDATGNQCVVVDFTTNTGIRILPDWDLFDHEAYSTSPIPTRSDLVESGDHAVANPLSSMNETQCFSLPARLNEHGDCVLVTTTPVLIITSFRFNCFFSRLFFFGFFFRTVSSSSLASSFFDPFVTAG